MSTLKTQVRSTVTEEVEIQLPLYVGWQDDIEDGRVSWETRMCIDLDTDGRIRTRSVTEWIGDTRKWELEIDFLHVSQVGQYLKYEPVQPSEFEAWVAKVVSMATSPGDR